MNFVIVIPTYNEAENIGRLIEVLDKKFKEIPKHTFNILVVEGNSPDGTADIVREKSKKYPFVHLLMEKEKKGLGAAYIYAFKHAMKNLDPDVLIEMDADFQHDPEDIKRFVAATEEGYDYVIGSRFTKGGSIPKEWEFYRKIISIGGNLFTKVVLGIFDISDFTTGYKASRVKGFVDKMNLDTIMSSGFAYKMELLYRMHKMGAKIKEIPIKFGLREGGVSKMERNNPFDSLRVVLTLRFKEYKKFIKFCVVGLAGLFVDTGLFNIFRIFIDSAVSALISGGFGMLTTFILNNKWSFKENEIKGIQNKSKSFVFYVAFSVIPIIVRSWLVRLSTKQYGNTLLVSNAAFFVGIVFGLIWNFTVYSKIIWRDKT